MGCMNYSYSRLQSMLDNYMIQHGDGRTSCTCKKLIKHPGYSLNIVDIILRDYKSDEKTTR